MEYIENFEKVGEKPGGTVPGYIAKDIRDGSYWIIKFPKHSIIAQNEVLAGTLYALAGVKVPELKLVEYRGENMGKTFAVASRFDQQLTRCNIDRKLTGLMEGFTIDAWLANWDVVGLEYDNILSNKAGDAVRVDLGGSILFRAQGEPKGKAFGPAVVELLSLRDPRVNPQSAKVFADLREADMIAGLMCLEAVQIDDIMDAVSDCQLPSKISDVLIERRDFILENLHGRPTVTFH